MNNKTKEQMLKEIELELEKIREGIFLANDRYESVYSRAQKDTLLWVLEEVFGVEENVK